MITTVTITGADNSVLPEEIANLSLDFNFVEWAILVSRSQQGLNRFPSMDWIKELVGMKSMLPQIKLSCHLCGAYVRQLLVGDIGFIEKELGEIWPYFERVQINTHAIEHELTNDFASKLAELYPDKEFIFQYDNVNTKMLEIAVRDHLKCSALFDLSHGAGILPEQWPQPIEGVKCGYAGGISPYNITHVMDDVNSICQYDTWIDMETWVRSADDNQFDLAKVDSCLTQASKFIN